MTNLTRKIKFVKKASFKKVDLVFLGAGCSRGESILIHSSCLETGVFIFIYANKKIM